MKPWHKPQPVKRIGLMGPFGYGNLGDAAIQEAMIHHIRERCPEAQIVGFSLNPEDTQARHGIESYPISRMSWQSQAENRAWQRLAAWFGRQRLPVLRRLERWCLRLPLEWGLLAAAYRHLRGIDLLIVSGGGQLDDYWGGGGPWSQPYTLLKYGLLARLRGARFMVVSVGAGPVDAPLSRLFIRLALRLSSYRSYRDEYSRNFVQEVVGLKRADYVYPDLALSLPRARLPARQHWANRPIVGIGPIGYFKAGCWPEADPETYQAYLSKLTNFVAWLIGEQHSIVFLPGEAHFDRLVIDDVRQCLAQSGLPESADAFIESDIRTVDELLQALVNLDFVCASRFHNVLLAQLAGKPVLALSYQAKIEALMQATGQSAYCFPIGTFDVETLKARFLELKVNAACIEAVAGKQLQAYQAQLEEQYDRILPRR